MLKQTGVIIGDKHLNGNVPNLKLGDCRYYPQDNPNLRMISRNKITRKAFIRILKKCFPMHIVDPNLDNSRGIEAKYYIGSMGVVHKLKDGDLMYEPTVLNKGYVCFKEASPKEDGTILYLHNGVAMAYKEQYIKATSK